jgi:hypothetical protein
MKRLFPLVSCAAGILACLTVAIAHADSGPFDGRTFLGRIAWSADGNHNDPDDWIASPVALAIFAQAGVRDRLVHFDYNCILPQTNPEWERIHAESVLGAAERYGYDRARFHDCRKDRDAAVDSIARAINGASAASPLYFIIAGPMEVPFLGIQKSEPDKRKFVYCISHSQWNDGFGARYTFTHTKRSVIPTGVHWVQIQDQNRLLSRSRYGRPAQPEEFGPYFWMRDSDDPRVRFLWERMLVSTRPDPSDAGMAYFLVTGDEQADPDKLKRLLDENIVPAPVAERSQVRIEAENFVELDGYELESRSDRTVSHRLIIRPAPGVEAGRVRTRFHQPYTAARGSYDVGVRYRDEAGRRCRLILSVNGVARNVGPETPGTGQGWTTHTLRGVEIASGDEIAVEAEGAAVPLDYVELDLRSR